MITGLIDQKRHRKTMKTEVRQDDQKAISDFKREAERWKSTRSMIGKAQAGRAQADRAKQAGRAKADRAKHIQH